jgi:CheY-like chemotaxis protein
MQKKINIILVQDNQEEIELIKKAFDKVNASYKLDIFGNGDEVLAYLGKISENITDKKPHLILMDIDVPVLDGPEILTRIKQDKVLRRIPIIIFSSSDDSGHIDKVYSLYGNCYIMKPKDHKQLQEALEAIWDFWSNTAALPGLQDI